MIIIQKNFFRKLWLDGRTGHSTYLMFFLVCLNFILISFNFLIEGNAFFKQFISDLWLFAIIFSVFYLPVSIIIGRWHVKTQISVDETMKILEYPALAMMVRTLLDVQTGKASEEETKEFRRMMYEIEKNDFENFKD